MCEYPANNDEGLGLKETEEGTSKYQPTTTLRTALASVVGPSEPSNSAVSSTSEAILCKV